MLARIAGVTVVAFTLAACERGTPTSPPMSLDPALQTRATAPTSVFNGQPYVADREMGKGDEVTDPQYNLNIRLRSPGETQNTEADDEDDFRDASGRVKFRQPGTNGIHTVYLSVRVAGLAPNTSYLLQRAVDSNLDGICTGTAWLTLGKGAQPQAITTARTGNGREELLRVFPPASVGKTFDIHFRIIRQDNAAVVLSSGCYRFTVR